MLQCLLIYLCPSIHYTNRFFYLEAKALAEKAMSDPMGAATQSLDKIKFW